MHYDHVIYYLHSTKLIYIDTTSILYEKVTCLCFHPIAVIYQHFHVNHTIQVCRLLDMNGK